MRFFKCKEFLWALKVYILLGLGFYFTLMQSAIAEMSVIGSSNSILKIEKVAVFDEPCTTNNKQIAHCCIQFSFFFFRFFSFYSVILEK